MPSPTPTHPAPTGRTPALGNRALLRSVLFSALVAAVLNLGTSALDHPRALAEPMGLLLPLAAGWLLLLPAACLWLSLGQGLGLRLGLAPGALRAGLSTTFVATAALAPVVEAGLRSAGGGGRGVVLALAAGLIGVLGVVAFLLGTRSAPAEARGEALQVAVTLGSLGVLAALWLHAYRSQGPVATAGASLVALGAAYGGRLASRRLRVLPLQFLLLGAVVLGAGIGWTRDHAAVTGAEVPLDRPPVVLLTVDTLRADRVLGQGPRRVPTPALDSLAADSVVFENARSSAPWTKPSLATLLTGVSPLVHGMSSRRARLPDELETLAEHLRAGGYHTGGVGLNAHLERAFRFDQGFQDYAFPARPDQGIGLGARLLERLEPNRYPELFPSTEAIADVACAWIRGHAREPFFLWVHVLDPHWPYEPPPEYLANPQGTRRWGEPEMVTNVQAGNTKPGAADRERVQELYEGEIRYVDDQLGRILGTLKELGLYQEALIVFASDHGEEFWEHGRYEHGHTLYDEVLRVPLAFKLPGGAGAGRVDAPVPTEALLPTVLDVLGLEFDPARLEAGSLTPWWSAARPPVDPPLFATGTYYFGEKRSVVFDGKKLVLELDTGRVELYDLGADPHELHSRASSEREEVERGLELIGDWERRCAGLRANLGVEVDQAQTGEDLERLLRTLGYAGDSEQP